MRTFKKLSSWNVRGLLFASILACMGMVYGGTTKSSKPCPQCKVCPSCKKMKEKETMKKKETMGKNMGKNKKQQNKGM